MVPFIVHELTFLLWALKSQNHIFDDEFIYTLHFKILKKMKYFLKFLEKMLFEKVSESFGWILQKSKFICDMGTFQTYLENWGEKRILATPLPKFWEKVRERREKWGDGRGREKKGISAMVLSKYVPKKSRLTYQKLGIDLTKIKKKKKKGNCGNWIVNCGKSNATSTNYFIIFLQIVVMANFLLVLIRAHQ